MDAIIQSNPVMEIAQELQNVETFLKQADFYKKKEKELREQLLKALEAAGLGSIKTSEGVSFSVVKGTEDELVDVETFDLALFKAENPEIYQKYATKSVQVKEGKKPSISIRGLKKIQRELVGKKNQKNNFGNYVYRTAEGILAEVKPLLKNCVILIKENVKQIGNRYYFESEAIITDGVESISAFGNAREDETLKGMVGGQISGATSSYAKKYALCNLFAIDGTEKDLDALEVEEESTTKQVNKSSVEGEKVKDSIDEYIEKKDAEAGLNKPNLELLTRFYELKNDLKLIGVDIERKDVAIYFSKAAHVVLPEDGKIVIENYRPQQVKSFVEVLENYYIRKVSTSGQSQASNNNQA